MMRFFWILVVVALMLAAFAAEEAHGYGNKGSGRRSCYHDCSGTFNACIGGPAETADQCWTERDDCNAKC